MNKVLAGLIAAFVATLLLSLLMVLKHALGLMPELELIRLIAGTAREVLHVPARLGTGWVIHWLVGTAGYGLAMAAIAGERPVRWATAKGVLLGLIGWLAMMLVITEAASAGPGIARIGLLAPLVTLVLHLGFGALLGGLFGRLVNRGHGAT